MAFPAAIRTEDKGGRLALALFIVALLASLGLLWWVSHNVPLLAGVAAATLLVAGVSYWLQSHFSAVEEVAGLPPDWTVTRVAADSAQVALAICDRAGRLVCANERYTQWFEGLRVPTDLPMDGDGPAALAQVGRSAWRDGHAERDTVQRGLAEYRVRAVRAGLGDDYLVWTFDPVVRTSLPAEASSLVAGSVGRALARSAVMAVTIGAEGRIRAANNAFAQRATGDINSNVVGRDFVTFLRVDDRGTIYIAHEGRGAAPVRLLHIPLVNHGDEDPEKAPLLLLMVDDDRAGLDRGAVQGHIEALIGSLPIGLALTDRDGRFLFANDSFARIVGISAESLPPYPGDLLVKEDKGPVADTIRRYASGAAMAGDIAIRLKDQPDEVVSLSVAGIRGVGEAAVLLSLRDNSEESKLKRQVAQATKMQAVGQLAGGVAHDFNNILTAIIGYCDLMLLRHAPGDSDYDDIQQIKNNSNRAASLTRQLLAFSRQQTLRPQILQLPDVVSDVSNLLKRLLGEKVSLEVRHGRGIGAVRADPGQLEQVIVNLCVNARDAMAGGGTVTVETGPVSASDVRAMKSDILPIADYARLSVSDTGHGIAKADLPKIFEPFFTTKAVGKGTGLGLSTVYGIVKQSGGFIFADSPPGAGARFDIYLPVHRGEGRALETAKSREAKPAVADNWGTGHILLVEDEDMVRAVAERALVRQGYTVDTACDGEEAIDRLKAGTDYDLIVSDVVMPNMDGPAMARQARSMRPQIRILFMSGYAEAQLRESINLDNIHFLPKPFSVQQIADAVKEAINN